MTDKEYEGALEQIEGLMCNVKSNEDKQSLDSLVKQVMEHESIHYPIPARACGSCLWGTSLSVASDAAERDTTPEEFMSRCPTMRVRVRPGFMLPDTLFC